MSKLMSPLSNVYQEGLSGNDAGSNHCIVIQELRPQAMSSVQAWPATVGDVEDILQPLADKCDVLLVGAGRFLIIDWDGVATAEVRSIDAKIAAVSDVGNARSVVRLSGDLSSRLLMKGMAIDMDETVTPIGTTWQSSIQGIGVIIHRESTSSFTLLCNRGYARSFWHWLTDEGAEFGVKILPSRF